MPEWRGPFRIVIAPFVRQAELFINDSIRDYGWYRGDCRVITRLEQMRGYDFSTWEVWWLDRMWPCNTREDVEHMETMKMYAKMRGARLRRWWT